MGKVGGDGMKEFIVNLALVFGGLAAIAGIVMTLSDIVPHIRDNSSHIDRAFHDTCVELRGKVVWNGRNWECLK